MKAIDRLTGFLLHSVFLVLMLMAVVLYKERLFADASYYFFHAINSGWFHIEHGRIVLGISQVLPLLGYYLGMPLKVLTVLSSLGHELFYYGIFLVLYYNLKDRAGAMVLLLVHLIGQLWLYYSPMLEICYGAALTVLFYSILRSGKYKDDKWLILLLLAQWFAMTSHPENFLLVLFVLAYDYLERGWKQKVHLSAIMLFGIAALIEVLTFSTYELGKVDIRSSDASALNLFDVSYLYDLAKLFGLNFPELIIMFLIIAPLLLIRKNWLKLGLFLGAILTLFVAVNQSARANEFTRYYESMYNPLVLLIVFLFIYELYSTASENLKKILVIACIAIAVLRINWTWDFGEPLRSRMTQMERITDYAQQLDETKFIIAKQNMGKSYSHIAWSLPIETLILTAIDGKQSSLSIATEDDYNYNNNKRILSDSSYIFRRYELEPHSFLNERFFQLKNENYTFLNTSVDLEQLENNKASLVIQLKEEAPVFSKGDTAYCSIRINNASDQFKLGSSIAEQLYISCHWNQLDGSPYRWDGIRNPIEIDIQAGSNFEQDIKLAVPDQAGEYLLQPDLVVEGKLWLGLSEQYKVIIE